MTRYTPTEALSLALFHQWEPDRIFVIVTVYIDESGTHDSSPLVVLGGWVGRLGQWAQFDPLWKKLLKRNGLPYYRSKEMRHSQKAFKGWSVEQKSLFMRRASTLAKKHLEFGFTISLADEDYKTQYVADRKPKSVRVDSQYGLCFRHVLGVVTHLSQQAYGARPLDIHFVLESGHRNFGDAERIFDEVKRSDDPDDQKVFQAIRTLTRGDKADFPGLQRIQASYRAAHKAPNTSIR